MEQHEKSKEGLTKHHNANYKCHSCKKCFEEIKHLGTINVKHWGKTKEQVPKKILKLYTKINPCWIKYQEESIYNARILLINSNRNSRKRRSWWWC